MIPMILIALLNMPLENTIDIVDSKDDSRISYVIVSNCKVKVFKIEFKDWDKVVRKVEKECGLDSLSSVSY